MSCKLIHVAKMRVQNRGFRTLFLRMLDPARYMWFEETQAGIETETRVRGGTAEAAIRSAYQAWLIDHFRMLHCGFRYTLPERDEVGTNALFHHMAASYASINGIYFDEELSSNCIVHNASSEARLIWKQLLEMGRIYTQTA